MALTDDQLTALSLVVAFDVRNAPEPLLEAFRQLADDELAKTPVCYVCGKYLFRYSLHANRNVAYCSNKCAGLRYTHRKEMELDVYDE